MANTIARTPATTTLFFVHADAKSTLEPLYKKFEEACEKDDSSIAVALYHPQAVIVKKDDRAVYGKNAIANKYKEDWEKVGKHTFKLSNQKYQGCEDYKIAEFDFELISKDTNAKIVSGKMLHIWKKEGGNWLIYHGQYEVSK